MILPVDSPHEMIFTWIGLCVDSPWWGDWSLGNQSGASGDVSYTCYFSL